MINPFIVGVQHIVLLLRSKTSDDVFTEDQRTELIKQIDLIEDNYNSINIKKPKKLKNALDEYQKSLNQFEGMYENFGGNIEELNKEIDEIINSANRSSPVGMDTVLSVADKIGGGTGRRVKNWRNRFGR